MVKVTEWSQYKTYKFKYYHFYCQLAEISEVFPKDKYKNLCQNKSMDNLAQDTEKNITCES